MTPGQCSARGNMVMCRMRRVLIVVIQSRRQRVTGSGICGGLTRSVRGDMLQIRPACRGPSGIWCGTDEATVAAATCREIFEVALFSRS